VPAGILASVPDNTQGGANLTFLFPLLLFVIVAGVLYVRVLARPHARVPARRIDVLPHAGPPGVGAAHAAAIAAGLPLAEGGGSAESGAEGAGARSAALAEVDAGTPPELASEEAAEGTSPADDAGAGE
jgi:hypothetical protein